MAYENVYNITKDNIDIHYFRFTLKPLVLT